MQEGKEMQFTDTRAYRYMRYATIAALLIAFGLSFLSCIRAEFVPWFPERMDDPSGFVKYIPMLPGFLRYLPVVAALLLLIWRRWSDIVSLVVMVLPVLITVKMQPIYKMMEPMGGLGGYVYSYTILGLIVSVLIVAAGLCIGILAFVRKRRQTE